MTDNPHDIGKLRILLGPGDTASFPSRIARALAERGANCWLANFAPNRMTASPDQLGKARLWAPRLVRLLVRLGEGNALERQLASALKAIGRLSVFVWALPRIDVVVFVSGRSLLPGYVDLWLFRLLGKRVVRIFLGTDSRPKFMNGWHTAITDGSRPERAVRRLSAAIQRQRRRVQRMSAWSDVVIENPLCGHFQQRPFINWFEIGLPHDPAFFERAGSAHAASNRAMAPGRINILHCPTNPKVKGTREIEEVVQRLIDEGLPIAYHGVTGVPHAEILDLVKRCDLVIDELYSDAPMAGFASESAAFGKCAIVGGYGWDVLQSRLGVRMPVNYLISPEPERLEQAIRELVADMDRAAATGAAARAFLETHWHHTAVADRFARILAGRDIPADWWCDPADIRYWQGLGAPDWHRRQVIVALVAAGGQEALGIDPKCAIHEEIRSWPEL